MKKTLQELELLGLTKNEALVYEALVFRGPSTVLQISDYAKINRSTVHFVIESLINKGLLSQSKVGERRVIIAEDPDVLSRTLTEDRRSLEKKEMLLQDLTKVVRDLQFERQKNTSVQLKYYDGNKSIANHYDRILKSREVRAYYSPADLEKFFPENPEKFYIAGKKGSLQLWDIQISNRKMYEAIERYKDIENFHFKFLLNQSFYDAMDYVIHDGYISIVSVLDDNPICIVIKNKILFENAKMLFNTMWDLLPD